MAYPNDYLIRTLYRDQLIIPSYKPHLLRILDLSVLPEVLNYTCFDTPKGLSYEGDALLGNILVANLCLSKKLTYISATPDEQVHIVQYVQYKSITMPLPTSLEGIPTSALLHSNHIHLVPSISSHHTKIIDCNTLYDSALLLVQLNIL